MDVIGRAVSEAIPLMDIHHRRLDTLMSGMSLNLLQRCSGLDRERTARVPKSVGTDIRKRCSTGCDFDDFVNGVRGKTQTPAVIA